MEISELPRVSGRHRNLALAKERRRLAVELVLTGSTYQHVADTMGYANRGTVYRLVQEALKAREVSSIDELRQLEAARLDALQAAYWSRATAGDIAAATMVLKIMVQRAKLLGLYPPCTTTSKATTRRGVPPTHDDYVIHDFGEDGNLIPRT